MKSSSGYILLTVLIFLQVFSFITLFHLNLITSLMKSNHHSWQEENFRRNCQQILHKLEGNLNPACLISITPALITKPAVWWQVNACGDNVGEIRYYYTIEFLGNDDCAIMGKGNIASYYRLSLSALPELKGKLYFLQLTIAIPVAATTVCAQKPHAVNQGRQFWREG